MIDCGSPFLPVSRTGIMLLYKDFFANRTDRDMLLSFGREGKVEQTEKQSELVRFFNRLNNKVVSNERYDESVCKICKRTIRL